ncbi:hypothetical protein K1719_022974 [Acacia pycnantha]|nr:hypothetical protein K1719_022974 [Acacia pycnantha]
MEGFTSIMHLPDDCLGFIFRCLNSSIDQQSFGLTCRRWLQIQNLNFRSLRFQCLFSIHLNRLLSRFQHLESLSLSVDITDSGFTFVQSYGSNLRNLDLRCSNVTDNGLTLAASGCPLLTSISLYRCLKITDNGLETLANGCPLLTTISLFRCLKITDYGLETLGNGCLSLKYVDLSFCSKISDKGVKALGGKQSGRTVRICCGSCGYPQNLTSSNRITSDIGSEYKSLIRRNLERVGMEGFTSIMHLPDDCLGFIFRCLNSSIDQQSFGLTCRRWLQIQNLNFRSLRFQRLFSIHLNRLLSRFQHLESLSLSVDITDSGFTFVQSYGSNLRNLDLRCCSNVTDNGLTLAASGCPLLTAISLCRCLKITDNGLETLANGCPLLTTISLFRCLTITDYGLETLANGCLSLKYVDLSFCSKISDKGLKALTQKCRQLQGVKISNCDGVAGVGFEGCSETLAYVDADSCKLTPDGIKGIVSGGGLEYLNVSCLSWSPFGDPTAGIGKLLFLTFKLHI